ncbi:AraC family transcriptional regulator [Actinomadura sp. NAK00032]|uniref:helix-turn-helix transcriptional regulator n=1 Tax=Actinomadura sp. NAK00032 TaxID=2742128 RepID=UPI001591640A|nr:AraC family transcriptional regulator [Actinomadura sp. NAK00032]QKW38838.1 AraC family transcriptional regulator [Actinomadura sp. NAK00032]
MADVQAPPPLLVIGGAYFDQGALAEQHQHPDEHLITWSATATVSLRTGERDWLVPPTHALWIPAGCPHRFEVSRAGYGYAVVLSRNGCPITWAEPTGVLVTPLLRELIVHLDGGAARARAAAESLLLALLEPVPSTAFHVPIPEDPRVRTIAEALLADPADPRDLAAWAHATSTGVRTITRLFDRETGMTFAQWRTLVRVRAALTHLARGKSVGATARAVGYRKPGAFAEAFHRVTGQHPSIYQGAGAPPKE